MSGETDLAVILSSLRPELSCESFCFIALGTGSPPDPDLVMQAWASIRETEGITLILEKDQAGRAGITVPSGGFPLFRRITLTVHSSLESTGLTAAVSAVLSGAGISANMVAGYHHDHIFVPQARAIEALDLLERLSRPGT